MAWQRVRAAVWCCVILGCGGSGDSPTRQAFDPGMVGNPDNRDASMATDAGAPSKPDAALTVPDASAEGDAAQGPVEPTTPDAGSEPDAAPQELDAGPVDPPAPVGVACGELGFRATTEGVVYAGACEGASLRLRPVARIGGVWYGAGKSGLCTVQGNGVVCGAGARGRIGVEIAQGRLRPYWDADSPGSLEMLGLEGELVLPGATAALSNGFQSWSQSGVLALSQAPEAKALDNALAARGEDEVYRKGTTHSVWYTFAGGGKHSFVGGALTADAMRTFAQVYREGNGLIVRLMNGGGGLRLDVKKGERRVGEWLFAGLSADLEALLRGYGEALPSRRDSRPTPAPAGWNSWYDLWDDVEETDVVATSGDANADIAKSMLSKVMPAGAEPLWIVVDDGWQKVWGTWETNNKFPSGLSGLAKKLKDRGLGMGLWFAPLLVDPDAVVAKQHPEWLVKGVTYDHPAHGAMRVLDVTHPGAASHLESVVKSFVAAGIGLLKIDFLFAGTWEGGRNEPVTGMQAYRRALALIRDAAGEDVRIVAVGAPPLVTFEYTDAWRVGNDIAFKPVPVINFPQPTWTFIANQARQVAARYPFCRVTLCDADPALLRDLSREQVEAGAWVAALTGGAMFSSDDLRNVPAERRTWGFDTRRMALGLSGTTARPESFFPAKLPTELVNMKDSFNLFNAEHDVPAVYRFADGTRVAFNFSGATLTIEGKQIPARAVRELARGAATP